MNDHGLDGNMAWSPTLHRRGAPRADRMTSTPIERAWAYNVVLGDKWKRCYTWQLVPVDAG